jgi:hypothetical protein
MARRFHTLSSGIAVRQDFRDSVRMVFYETGCDGWRYASHGGTAFVVVFKGRPYAFTCRHVPQDFDWHQLIITNTKLGHSIAGLKSVAYATRPEADAQGTDVVDVAVIEFSADVTPAFFHDTAYIVDDKTTVPSQHGDPLHVSGVLKEKIEFGDGRITPSFCLLEFDDDGALGIDPTLRKARARYVNPEFSSLTGLSGAPVYNRRVNALCGMVVRGGMSGNDCNILYFDVFDMMQLLSAVHEGQPGTYYRKRSTVRRTEMPSRTAE